MAIKEPESMEELVYFTNRKIKDGNAKAWVYKAMCPKCNKGLMGKPVDPKTKKPKIRAKEYVCPECNFTQEKEEYEDTLDCQIIYTCPECKHKGEAEVSFKRKRVMLFDVETQKKKAADAVIFNCDGCGEKIPITKKMKS